MAWDESSGGGTPAGPLAPGDGGLFGSSPAEKNAAANDIETELEPDTKKTSDGAKESTNTAARTLDGWETASGLKKVVGTWDQQVRVLMGRLAAEKASLRNTSSLFIQNDLGTASKLRGVRSSLDEL
ncbi:hypothetical protein OG909_32605 [Streptomyces sp. NBC_01754]|uniref:hypothetical protein n=1 Tax=Streptomyces sp. NBC_01754 TaxID=2975930 RepID=UPI002DD9918D|nr:hypothetical protein [Streptomyces sp. NBC_01754]WSC90832.1 hypothetical protein OG909_00100 [Streptomyces sp. NBC_01754]WSC96673.1 hypothetical protein OG909_32605 [Streptomyces sp. NBC_01754]